MTGVFLGWSLGDVADAVGGDLVGRSDRPVAAVVSDSRGDVDGGLFVALEGDTFDGHSYVDQVLSSGAVAVVVQSDSAVDATPRIEVESTGDALAALAVKRRDELDIPTIAITGSTGKTSTKDLLAAGLDGSWASPRSFNNEIGVPLTVLSTPSDATALILEVGTRGTGQIEWLAPIIKPSVSVITNLGLVHLETFGSLRNLANAKYELIDALGPGGVAVLPADEPSLLREGSHKTITFGKTGADVMVTDVTTDDGGLPSFTLHTAEGDLLVSLPLPGAHHASNTAAAVGVALALGLEIEAFVSRLESATGSDWRMDVHRGRYTVVNDAYNANPQSVESALTTVASMSGRHIAVLGLMAELGSACEREHIRLGRIASDLGFCELVVVGPDHGFAVGFGGNARKAANIEDAADTLAGIVEPGDVVLVKASRSASLERLALQLIKDSAS
ncbi:MAG: UDP-N-acetylmuramoyl-tripeptide--D-alanyl-D-alanine ligase [Acidimicrobiia bacterium]|nr:MAG: UDP-N-acetylmuramoyl-tripeptide--D-alanyl-D-alanine ligase [Acidimicrobiia bacterium]